MKSSLEEFAARLGRFPIAILAGLLLAAAFPKIGVAGFAWIAPGILVAAGLGKPGGERFRIGYTGALAYYLAFLYWLLLIPYRWYGIPFGPATGWLALSGVLALFPAAWVWLVAGTFFPRTRGRNAEPEPSTSAAAKEHEESAAAPVANLRAGWNGLEAPPTWMRRTLWPLFGAAAWVCFEMVLARFLGGFPWDLLGVSQYRMIPLIQVASITGVYGVSFLIVWFSLALMSAGLMMLRGPAHRMSWMGEVILPVLAVAVAFNFGLRRVTATAAPERTIKATLVQPSIPQTVIWNSESDETRFQDLIMLTEQALTNKTDLLIWPESAIPNLLRYNKETFSAVAGLARRHHVWFIVGADDAEPRPGATTPEDVDYFNASFLVSPEGELAARYIKRSLVIFGEYIPLARWLPFLKWFTPIQGGFTPGTHPVQFELPSLDAQTSVLICFEDVFPQLGRSSTTGDTDFLVNITNDGWFGESAEQWQHATTALFRAVENGVPLIRCTNNGVTCWIDAKGRIREVFHDSRGTVYGPGFMTVQIPVPARGTAKARTFYNQHGDVFGWSCLALTSTVLALQILGAMRERRRR